MKKKVGIVMGSDSDLPVAQKAAEELKALGIPFAVRVISAHRTPDEAAAFSKSARDEGFGVIIAFAGMAAHLCGVLAAHTTLPVIGVPCKGGALDGLDALLSTVQMPQGVPVAAVGLNAGLNAALLAAQMLALGDDALAERLTERRRTMADGVRKKDAEIQNIFGGEA